MRGFAKEPFDLSPHHRDPCRSADQDDLVDLVSFDPGILQRPAARLQRPLDDWRDERLELFPRDVTAIGFGAPGNAVSDDVGVVKVRQIPLRLDDGLANGLHRCAGGGRVETEFAHNLLDQQPVDIVAAKMRVAVGRQHLKYTVLDLENRDVEGAPAKVVDGDDALMPLVEAVSKACRRRLIDDAQNVKPGEPTGVASGSPLGIIEIRGHGDDRSIHFGIEITLTGEHRFGAPLELSQNEAGDLGRGQFTLAQVNVDDAAGLAAGSVSSRLCASRPT